MSLWIGRRESIGVGRETTRGVGVAPTYWLNCLSFNFADKPTRAKSEASFAGIWGGDQAPMTLSHAEGDMEVELGDRSWGLMLYAIMGACATSGPADTTAYTHTFTPLANTNAHTALTIHTVDPIGAYMFELAMVNSLELSVTPDKLISYTVNFLAKPSQDAHDYTASYGTEQKFTGRHLVVKLAANTGSLAAATAASIKEFTLTFDKNAEVQATLGTIQPEDIVNKRFTVSGKVTLNYEDRTWLNYVKNASYMSMRVQIVGTTLVTGAAATYPTWTLDLSKCMFEAWEPDFALDDVVTQTINFEALYDAGTNNNVVNTCTMVNPVVSY